MGGWNKGYRTGDDIPLNPASRVPDEDPPSPPHWKNLPTSYHSPEDFNIGTNRIGMLQDKLLLLYGEISKTENMFQRNEIEAFVVRYKTSKYWETYSDLKAAKTTAIHLASSLIGEVRAFGGHAYIPIELQGYIYDPQEIAPGLLVDNWNDDHDLPEQYAVPDGLPSGPPIFRLEYVKSKKIESCQIDHTMAMENVNGFLSILYAEIGHRANRIMYLQRMHALVDPNPPGSSEALSANVRSALVHFDNASVIIKSRLGSPELFLMPEILRDQMLSLFSVERKYPASDLECLFHLVLTAPGPSYTMNLRVCPIPEHTKKLRAVDLLICQLVTISSGVDYMSASLRSSLNICLHELQLHPALLASFLDMDPGDYVSLENILTRVEFNEILLAAEALDVNTAHLCVMQNLAKLILEQLQLKPLATNHLETAIRTHLPNFSAIVRPKMASTLLALAGSVEKLSSSSVEGLKSLGSSVLLPGNGLISDHKIHLLYPTEMRSSMLTNLAEKILLALRVDMCPGASSKHLGECLLDQLERLVNDAQGKEMFKPRPAMDCSSDESSELNDTDSDDYP